MESITKLLISILIGFSLSACGQDVKWYTVQSKEGNYKINFPKKPSYGERNITSESGDVVLKYYQYEAWKEGNDKNLHYLVGYSELPDNVMNSENKTLIPTYLDRFINGTLQTSKGVLLNKRDITIGGFSGREAQIEIGNGIQIVTLRVYFVHNKSYQIQVMTSAKNSNNDFIQKFMNSFQLDKNKVIVPIANTRIMFLVSNWTGGLKMYFC